MLTLELKQLDDLVFGGRIVKFLQMCFQLSTAAAFSSESTSEACKITNKIPAAEDMGREGLKFFSRKISGLLRNRIVVRKAQGSGCGSVGRAVASNTRGPRFESNHW